MIDLGAGAIGVDDPVLSRDAADVNRSDDALPGSGPTESGAGERIAETEIRSRPLDPEEPIDGCFQKDVLEVTTAVALVLALVATVRVRTGSGSTCLEPTARSLTPFELVFAFRSTTSLDVFRDASNRFSVLLPIGLDACMDASGRSSI